MKSERGVTLIEMMIAITLVAAISGGMLMAIRISLLTLDKTGSRLQANRRSIGSTQILTREIGGVIPVQSFCASNGGEPSMIPFFLGTPQSLHFVTSYSISEGSRGYPHVLVLQILRSENGGLKLVANEALYTGPTSTLPVCLDHQPVAVAPGPGTFVVADRLARCRFLYQDITPDKPMPGDWLAAWERPDLPAAVKVEMTPLDASPTALPVMTATIPIHVTRQVRTTYEDFQ